MLQEEECSATAFAFANANDTFETNFHLLARTVGPQPPERHKETIDCDADHNVRATVSFQTSTYVLIQKKVDIS
jgi:hypothetical protein